MVTGWSVLGILWLRIGPSCQPDYIDADDQLTVLPGAPQDRPTKGTQIRQEIIFKAFPKALGCMVVRGRARNPQPTSLLRDVFRVRELLPDSAFSKPEMISPKKIGG